ncbi:MAG: AI-2E family transporter [Actinomycetota bacterium]|nr:AI-2E family transporter [Actinomycetota bacterium]
MTILNQSESFGGRLRRVGVLSWSIIGIMVLLAFLFRFVIYPIRSIFPPLALAFIVVFLLNPLVNRLVRRTPLRRVWATLVVYLAFVAVSTVVLINIVPLVAHQVSGLLDKLPAYVERGARNINRMLGKRGSSIRIRLSSDEVVTFIESHRSAVVNFLGHVRAFGASVLRVFVAFLLAMVISFYILVDLPKIRRALINALPADRQDEVLDLGKQIGAALGGFFRGQFLVAVFVGAASALGLALIRLPFAVLVGMIAGIFNLVPLIGPFIGAVPAVLIGLLSGDPNKAWQSMLVLLAVQQIDNHVISPNVMGRTVRLHPITVMLALLAGGTLAGIGGMLIVVPGVAVTKIIAAYVWGHRGRFVSALPGPVQSVDTS